MSRLRRELKPYISGLRISQYDLIVFIEGKDFDPVFYGRITQRYASESGLKVEVRRADDLPTNAESGSGGSGGRLQMCCAASLWEQYRVKHLISWKKRKAIVFCIDKDIDDIVGIEDDSPSIIRTCFHSIENHLIADADLASIMEAALSLEPGELATMIASSQQWLMNASALWRDWIVFCILCRRLETQGIANYSQHSLLNAPAHEPAIPGLRDFHFLRLRKAAGWNEDDFQVMRQQTEILVDEMLAAGQHHRIFKGRWYIDVLFAQLRNSKYGPHAKALGKNGLSVALRTRFIESNEDYAYYRDEFTRMIAGNLKTVE